MAFDTGNLGKLIVEIGADIAELKKGLSEADTKVKTFGQQVGVSTRGIASAFGAVSLAIVGALGGAVAQTVKYNDEIFRASQRTGIATETLSKLKFVAEQTESSFEGVVTGLKFLAKNAFEAEEGNKELAVTFRDLGIQLTDSRGNLLSVDELLLQAADRFSQLENETEKTALAVKIFGRSGTDLIPVLNLGRQGIERLSKRAEELGIVLTKDNAKAIDDFDDSMKELKASIGGVAITIGTAIIPKLKELVEFIKTGVIPIIENLKAAFDLINKTSVTNQINQATASQDPVLENARRELIALQEQKERLRTTIETSGGRGTEGQQNALNNLLIQEERLRGLVVDRMQQQKDLVKEQVVDQQAVVDKNAEAKAEVEALVDDLSQRSTQFSEEQIQIESTLSESLKELNVEQLNDFKTFLEQKSQLSTEKEKQITAALAKEITARTRLEQVHQQQISASFNALENLVKTFLGESKAAAIALKAISVGRAIINTALGVTQALALGPAGIPLARAIKVLGAIEVAAILATGFAKGTDTVPAKLTPGEMVVPNTFADAIRKGKLTLGGPEGNQQQNSQLRDVVIENIEIKVEGNLDNNAVPSIMEQIGLQIDARLRGAT